MMKVENANEILKKVLKNNFLDFLDFITDRLDEKLGEDHCVITGIIFMNIYKILIVNIGASLKAGIKLETLNDMYPPKNMKNILYDSIFEFYDTYQIYINAVTKYIESNNLDIDI